jgi:hypothetical protein
MSIKYDEFFHDDTSRYMRHFYKWGMSDEPDEMLIQNKAKREVNGFIRRKMKEYHEQSDAKA